MDSKLSDDSAHNLGSATGPTRHGRRHGNRLFDYGDLRLLILAKIAEQPRYGYELIKSIEERSGGSYTPSAGVIYPSLAWLDEMGYAAIEIQDSSRKRYRITPEGAAFLFANRTMVDKLLARAAGLDAGGQEQVPDSVLAAMNNLKSAMRLRFKRGPADNAAAAMIAAALDAAAATIRLS